MKHLFNYHPKLTDGSFIKGYDTLLNFKEFNLSLWEELSYKKYEQIINTRSRQKFQKALESLDNQMHDLLFYETD